MNIRKILFIVSLFGSIGLLSVVSPVLACDPDTGDVADCVVKGTPPAALNPTAVATLVAASAKSNGDSATGLANSPALPTNSFPLACLLPDGDNFSNALGVTDQCPAPPVQIRAAKVVPTPLPAPKPVVVPTPIQPKGDAPSSAKTITDTWQTLNPGAVHWYRIDNDKNFYLNVYIDDNGASGITLSLFSPDQANDLSVDLQPKGRGAPVKNEPHDLLWKGSFATGVWYALVRNYNPNPLQYKIGIAQSTTYPPCRR